MEQFTNPWRNAFQANRHEVTSVQKLRVVLGYFNDSIPETLNIFSRILAREEYKMSVSRRVLDEFFHWRIRGPFRLQEQRSLIESIEHKRRFLIADNTCEIHSTQSRHTKVRCRVAWIQHALACCSCNGYNYNYKTNYWPHFHGKDGRTCRSVRQGEKIKSKGAMAFLFSSAFLFFHHIDHCWHYDSVRVWQRSAPGAHGVEL